MPFLPSWMGKDLFIDPLGAILPIKRFAWPFQQITEVVMQVSRTPRILFTLSPNTLRVLTVFLGSFIPNLPVSSFWLDYFAVNRTCPVDSMPRIFGLMPARFTYRLDYLIRKPWYEQFWTFLSQAFRNLVAKLLESLKAIRLMR